MLDEQGSRTADAGESYWHSATGGSFPPPDLRLGERLLVDLGLVQEVGEQLIPQLHLTLLLDGDLEDAVADILSQVLTVSDPRSLDQEALEHSLAREVMDAERREQLLALAANRFDDSMMRLVGDLGERLVVERLRSELADLGYPDLSREVRQVSLLSDQLGYDVVGPRVAGPRRLLEVKATTAPATDRWALHLSRNEFETGITYRDWALVVVQITDLPTGEGAVIGWCPAQDLTGLTPSDSPDGRWEVSEIKVPQRLLMAGLPSATV